MPKLGLPRDIIASIVNNNKQAIYALEQTFGMVNGFPTTIEEANALAGSALAVAQVASAGLSQLVEIVSRLEMAPPPQPYVEPDDTAPRVYTGTLARQDADNVEITGGSIDGTTIGLTTAADGKFKKLSASDQFTSTVATGTPPLVIDSTDLVPNLYAARAANANHANNADSLTSPTTYPANATDLPSVITLANALKAANISKGV